MAIVPINLSGPGDESGISTTQLQFYLMSIDQAMDYISDMELDLLKLVRIDHHQIPHGRR